MIWNCSFLHQCLLIYLLVLHYLDVYVLTFRQMTMEMVESQPDDNAVDSMPERDAGHLQNQPGRSQISRGSEVASIADESAESEGITDSQKRREILSRRPSYRKILNELSSDVPAIPKIEEEEKSEDEGAPSGISPMDMPTSLYHTNTRQYTWPSLMPYGAFVLSWFLRDMFPIPRIGLKIHAEPCSSISVTITQRGTVQISNPISDGAHGLQTLTMTNSGAPQPGATIVQYAGQSPDGAQQFFVPGSQVVVQAATGDMPAYQIRTPTTTLPQGVVMAASPGTLHSPQQLAEEATRKRELRLMKNREAARECRRKKKEYVKCLENRVAVLENQNKTLIEELKALKDLYCHKAE
uniref:cAMP-responsive element modulator n=2 Tax=Falco TaxID=8952 RepID=A0A8C4UVC2_FALTI